MQLKKYLFCCFVPRHKIGLLEIAKAAFLCKQNVTYTIKVQVETLGAFHIVRPEYVRRELRKMHWRTKEKSCFLAYIGNRESIREQSFFMPGTGAEEFLPG